jgi:hypothetical protein
MAKDKYWAASQRAARTVDYQIAQAQSDLNTCVSAGDKDGAAQAVLDLSNLARQKENLTLLQQQYAQSRQAAQPQQKSPEEWQAAPISRMDANDAQKLWQTSKYGKDLNWGDENVRRGFVEAMTRRARGE